MSKAELFKMHVYMCACLYIDITLLIYYLCCKSLFKTSLYLFLWKYSSRKITDLSLCPFQWLLRSLFVTPWWASVQFPSLCHEWTGSWRAWFILMVPAAGTSETCCTTPGSFLVFSLAFPCGDGKEQRHQETYGMKSCLSAALASRCLEESLHHSPVSWDLGSQHPTGNTSVLRQQVTVGSFD